MKLSRTSDARKLLLRTTATTTTAAAITISVRNHVDVVAFVVCTPFPTAIAIAVTGVVILNLCPCSHDDENDL